MEPPKLFRDLVKAGAALEEEARDAIEAGQAARNSVEDRINRVRENFNLQRPARGEDLLALHEKIDRLGNRIDELTEALAASGVLKPQRKTAAKRKKSAATKKAPSSKNKTAASKSAATKRTPGTAGKARAARSPRKATAGRSRK